NLVLIAEVRNNIALLRLAIGSSIGRNVAMEYLVNMIDMVDMDGIQLVEEYTVIFNCWCQVQINKKPIPLIEWTISKQDAESKRTSWDPLWCKLVFAMSFSTSCPSLYTAAVSLVLAFC
nr:hypothetical protein [Tanacetum cinerariifolium]